MGELQRYSFPMLYCCAVTTATLVTPQDKDKCFHGERCIKAKYFHHPVMNEANGNVWASHLILASKYDLIVKLTLSTDPESTFTAIDTAFPCILHGGNCLGEKIFMMLFNICKHWGL